MVRCLDVRAGDDAVVLRAWLVLHMLCACNVVWRRLFGSLRGLLHLLEGGGVDRHGLAAAGRKARDRTPVVAPLHGAAVLLALLLLPHRHRSVVRGDELFRALRDVRLLRPD